MGLFAEQLEREITQAIRAQGIVVWVDPPGHGRGFVEGLRARFQERAFPYPTVAFDGSFLATLYALEPHLSAEVVYLLVYVPGLTEATVDRTPLLEVKKAGQPLPRPPRQIFEEVAGALVPAEDLRRFLSGWDGDLEVADRWLTARATDDPRVVRLLDRESPADVVQDLILDGRLLNTYGLQPGDLQHWLQHTFGFTLADSDDELRERLFAHLLCVEYVADLAPTAPSERMADFRGVPEAAVSACRHATARLRAQRPDEYEQLALDLEAQFGEERAWAQDKELGRVDTFRFEDQVLAEQALLALERRDHERAARIAVQRLGEAGAGGSFWVGRDPQRRWLWEWIREAASLWGLATPPAAPLSWRTHREAVDAYTATLARVDRSHRRFEQQDARLRGLHSLAEFPRTRGVVRGLRDRVRRYVDATVGAWSALCDAAGPLPPADLQLRRLFEEDVAPRTSGSDTLALFMVDALRYELALELREVFDGLADASCTLKPRLAELPTETFVGMNAIPPVARDGRLTPAWTAGGMTGFRTGEFAVTTPDDRRKAISQRVGMTPVPGLKLDQVIGATPEMLRDEIKGAKVVVVHSREIDSAGHAGVGISHFDLLVGQLVAAFHRLNAAGVRTFVFTADHGFLLGDETAVRDATAAESPQLPARYLFARHADLRPSWSCFSLASLAYDSDPSRPEWLLFARDSRIFSKEIPTFIHGGNSLQERLVPVLTVIRTPPAQAEQPRQRRLEVEVRPAGFGAVEIELQVLDVSEQHALAFMVQEVDLALRVADRSDVSVVLGEVHNAARLAGGALRVRVGDAPARAVFRLEGRAEGVARVELHGVSERIPPYVLAQPIPVIAVAGPGPAVPPDRTDWLDGLPTELAPFRAVFRHLEAHATLGEDQLVSLLGGPPVGVRQARVLSRLLADARWRAHLPFDVQIHDTGGRKQYIRETRKG